MKNNAELRKMMISRNYEDALVIPSKKVIKKFKFDEDYERFGNKKFTNRSNIKRDFHFFNN